MKHTTSLTLAAAVLIGAFQANAAPKPKVPKFVFVGKLVSKERVNVGRGGAFGKVSRDKLKFEITEVRKGKLKKGVVAPCEIGGRVGHASPVPVKKAKIGQLYLVDALYKHPAHVDGLYLLNCRIHKLADAKDVLEAALPIVVGKHGGASSGQAGVALYRERPNLTTGDKLTFTGRFEKGQIRLLDPPWVMVRSDRQLHWRIYFFIDTDEGSKRAVSKFLEPAQMMALEKLPVVQKYIAAKEASAGRSGDAPELSLHIVYGGKVPKEFAKLDARETIASLFCDNLGRPNATMQQCFSMRPDKKPAEGIAQFTGTLHLNRPDLNYHQREKQKLHHFNFKLTNAKPIRVKLTEAEMKKQFISEIEKASRCPATTLQKQELKIPIQPQDRPAPIVACRPTSSIRPDHPAPPVLAPTRALRHRVRLF